MKMNNQKRELINKDKKCSKQIYMEDNMSNITDIEVYNGYDWYSAKDCFEESDDFVIRVKKDG